MNSEQMGEAIAPLSSSLRHSFLVTALQVGLLRPFLLLVPQGLLGWIFQWELGVCQLLVSFLFLSP